MSALTNLWNSEKGIIAIALIIAATVLTALGHITAGQWISYSEWIFAFYVGGKTVQGAVAALASSKAPPKDAPSTPPSS